MNLLPAVALIWLAIALITVLVAGRKGYDQKLFLIGGLLGGPFALLAALTASQYVELDEDDAAQPVDLAPIASEKTQAPADSEVIEAVIVEEDPEPEVVPAPEDPAPTEAEEKEQTPGLPDVQPLDQTAPGESESHSAVEEFVKAATVRPQQQVRVSMHPELLQEADEEIEEEPEPEVEQPQAMASDQPKPMEAIAPGEVTAGVCPHCQQESYASWNGLCVRCQQPFPVNVSLDQLLELEGRKQGKTDQQDGGEATSTPTGKEQPKKLFGVTLPSKGKGKTAPVAKGGTAIKSGGTAGKAKDTAEPKKFFGMTLTPQKKDKGKGKATKTKTSSKPASKGKVSSGSEPKKFLGMTLMPEKKGKKK